jgi:polyferredoxin
MRQRIRRIVTLIFFLLFPVTLNYFSPYVSIDGAMNGVISGSVIVFAVMFLTGIFFGRAWCAWVCPMECLSDICMTVNDRRVNAKRLKIIRYAIFGVWFAILIAMFVLAGGIRGFDPLRMTSGGISVDMPMKYIIYYLVLALYVVVSLTIGRRGACHSFCWMSPFLVAGYHFGKLLRIPQLRIVADKENCVKCGKCTKLCPMSIDVQAAAQSGAVATSDCILCGLCADECPKDVLHMKAIK